MILDLASSLLRRLSWHGVTSRRAAASLHYVYYVPILSILYTPSRVQSVRLVVDRQKKKEMAGSSKPEGVFKSDHGALSVKESREMLLTTRSSSERSL